MVKVEVQIVSREVIKPTSPIPDNQKPYKLSLLDQLTPTTYSPVIFFYPMTEANANVKTITENRTNRLKKAISRAINVYYPLSGRAKDNLFIDSFNEGVPFVEARVNCRLSEFLRHLETESLNAFLPCQPYTKEDMTGPLVGLQVTMFTCGGMAVAGVASHKLVDGLTSRNLFIALASMSRGDHKNLVQPDFEEASRFFPSSSSFPQNHLSLMESLWFTEGNYITRRFVFNSTALAVLKGKAKAGKPDINPSRVEVLSCFIWQHCMAASRAVSGSPKPSILVQAVDLRSRTKPPMSYASIGNGFWWATALVNPMGTKTDKLHELVALLKEATALYDSDYTQTLQGEEGSETMSEYFNQLEALFSLEKPDIFAFTNWCYNGYNSINFGWGDPIWVGLVGKVGPAFRNLTVFVDTKYGKGIEAWITLDEERMTLLEHDPEFLALASPNPKISSL